MSTVVSPPPSLTSPDLTLPSMDKPEVTQEIEEEEVTVEDHQEEEGVVEKSEKTIQTNKTNEGHEGTASSSQVSEEKKVGEKARLEQHFTQAVEAAQSDVKSVQQATPLLNTAAQQVLQQIGNEKKTNLDFLAECPNIVQTFNLALIYFQNRLIIPFPDYELQLKNAMLQLDRVKTSPYPLKTWINLFEGKEEAFKDRTPQSEAIVLPMLVRFKQFLANIDLQEEWPYLTDDTQSQIWFALHAMCILGQLFKVLDRELILEIDEVVREQITKLTQGTPDLNIFHIFMSIKHSIDNHPKLLQLIEKLDMDILFEQLQLPPAVMAFVRMGQ